MIHSNFLQPLENTHLHLGKLFPYSLQTVNFKALKNERMVGDYRRFLLVFSAMINISQLMANHGLTTGTYWRTASSNSSMSIS